MDGTTTSSPPHTNSLLSSSPPVGTRGGRLKWGDLMKGTWRNSSRRVSKASTAPAGLDRGEPNEETADAPRVKPSSHGKKKKRTKASPREAAKAEEVTRDSVAKDEGQRDEECAQKTSCDGGSGVRPKKNESDKRMKKAKRRAILRSKTLATNRSTASLSSSSSSSLSTSSSLASSASLISGRSTLRSGNNPPAGTPTDRRSVLASSATGTPTFMRHRPTTPTTSALSFSDRLTMVPQSRSVPPWDVTPGKPLTACLERSDDEPSQRLRAKEGNEKTSKGKEKEDSEAERSDSSAESEAVEEKGVLYLLETYYPDSFAAFSGVISTKMDPKVAFDNSAEENDEAATESDKPTQEAAERDPNHEDRVIGGYAAPERRAKVHMHKPERQRKSRKWKTTTTGAPERRKEEGRMLRMLSKSGDILLCVRKGEGDTLKDGRGRRAEPSSATSSDRDDSSLRTRTDLKIPAIATNTNKESSEEDEEDAKALDMERAWKRMSQRRRNSEPSAVPSRDRKAKIAKREHPSSFILSFEERKEPTQIAREKEEQKEENKRRWRAYSFITPRRLRSSTGGSHTNSKSAKGTGHSPRHDNGMAQGRQRSSSVGAPESDRDVIEMRPRALSSTDRQSDAESFNPSSVEDDDIYGAIQAGEEDLSQRYRFVRLSPHYSGSPRSSRRQTPQMDGHERSTESKVSWGKPLAPRSPDEIVHQPFLI